MLETLNLLIIIVTLALVFVTFAKLRKNSGTTAEAIDVEKQLGPTLATFEERSLNHLTRHKDELRNSQIDNFKLIQESMEKLATSLRDESRGNRQEAEQSRLNLERSVNTTLEGFKVEFKEQGEKNERRIVEVRETLQTEIEKLRQGNEAKLEKMRETVDEKLQSTLDKRISESFQQVSEHLRAVQSGLGEMKNLATGVGDLKRVLTNVKNRGGWGEVQLGRQLEDMLTKDQFDKNISVRHGSQEKVEYVIKLPGRIDGEVVYLPIDAKFPHEDYERLVQAIENGALEDVEIASREIEKRIKAEAEKINDKYINPPVTTDFAIMYLPTEGLYAEVIRRPGLVTELQNKHRVLITGPTTLMAILNSLQMGFKTLAIEKSTSEVWRILGAVKQELSKYSKVWEKLDVQISRAQNTVQTVATRSRALERSLKGVETLSAVEGSNVLQLADFVADESDVEDDEADADE
jgi:DNA recombination protein RmuC